jgi:nicotinate-nucleotide adenylyltransferase
LKIGVFGGTFDPVHRAHIAVAEAARDALKLDKVLLVPAGKPMARPVLPLAPAKDRVAMLRLAIEGKPGLEVSTIEIDRPGPTYTVDSITQLRNSAIGTDIYFILGNDSLAQLTAWKDPAQLISMCRLVAVPRPGCEPPDLTTMGEKIPGISKNVIFLKEPNFDVSATEIRERISAGKPITELVTAPVADYIKKHKLYQTGGKK